MNPLAPTTFSSGPKDALATVDVYGASGALINSIQDQKTASSFDISSLLSNGGKGAISGVTSLLRINQKTGGVSLDLNQLTSRVNSAIPAVGSSIRNLSSNAKDTLTQSFTDYGSISVNMGGETFSVDSSKSTDLFGYSDFVNDVNAYGTSLSGVVTTPGSCSLYDVDSHSSLISAGILQGSNIGIPNAVSTLTSPTAVSDNAALLSKVATSCLPILVKNGDLGNLAALSSTQGRQVFDAVYPGYASQLIGNYSPYNYGRNTGASVQDYQSIISIFTNVNSSWNVFDRIGDTTENPTLNLLKLLGGTSAFQELLAIGVKNLVDGDSGKGHILATMFGKTDVVTQLKTNFPRVVLEASFSTKNKTTSKAQTVDPRVLQLIGTGSRTLITNI